MGSLDGTADQSSCLVKDRLNRLLRFVEKGLCRRADGAQQPALVLALRLLALGRRLLLVFVPGRFGFLLPLLVVGGRPLLGRAPLECDGCYGFTGFRVRVEFCASHQLLLGARPLAADTRYIALRHGAFAGLFIGVRLLELRDLCVGPGAFARGPLRILLALARERRQAGADRALDFGALLLFGDDGRRLVILGRLWLSSRLTRDAGHFADGSAQRFGGCGWGDVIANARFACFRLPPWLPRV